MSNTTKPAPAVAHTPVPLRPKDVEQAVDTLIDSLYPPQSGWRHGMIEAIDDLYHYREQIVRAVNSHQALIELAQRVFELADTGAVERDLTLEELADLREQARTALAKAKGEAV